MKATSTRRLLDDPALAWSQRLEVEVGGTGTVAQGVVLPRLLADRLGLTTGLAEVVAWAGFVPVRHRGRVLVDTACALAAGATCLSDVEAMTAQEEFYGSGGGASDSTMLRVLDELAERVGANGLPGRRLARATAVARARAWAGIVARHGQLPAVRVAGRDLTRPATEPGGRPRPVLGIRLDATLIEAASPKARAAGHYKGGFGFYPLTGWCANIGDALAVMQRPGNAGSFTAADHLAVLKASFAQVPAQWRADALVSIDGAGGSDDVIDYLTSLNRGFSIFELLSPGRRGEMECSTSRFVARIFGLSARSLTWFTAGCAHGSTAVGRDAHRQGAESAHGGFRRDPPVRVVVVAPLVSQTRRQGGQADPGEFVDVTGCGGGRHRGGASGQDAG